MILRHKVSPGVLGRVKSSAEIILHQSVLAIGRVRSKAQVMGQVKLFLDLGLEDV